MKSPKQVALGLRENRQQFIILVIVNAFVGGMIGLERTILPKLAESEFAIKATSATLSFIVVFGIVKAITNYYTGYFANRVGRKNLLILGWLFGIPVPFILLYCGSWNWVLFANVLLGINQGLTWSSTVVMKIDLVGEKQRGFAMGLNEFAGYIAVAIIAFLTGWIASDSRVRPYPFYLGIVISISGLLLSIFLVKDTRSHAHLEHLYSTIPRLKSVFWETTFKHRILGSVTQAGLINNLNDGMIWGLLPILLNRREFTLGEIGIITAIYPAVWGLGQLITGKMSDIYSKRKMLFYGMFLQGIAIIGFIFAEGVNQYIILAAILGWGTAMVYPTFLSTIAENTNPIDRAKSLGIFRLWRDLGYAIGAILTGILTDVFGIHSSIWFIGILTLMSSFIILLRMKSNSKIQSK